MAPTERPISCVGLQAPPTIQYVGDAINNKAKSWGWSQGDVVVKWGWSEGGMRVNWGLSKGEVRVKQGGMRVNWGWSESEVSVKLGWTEGEVRVKWDWSEVEVGVKWDWSEGEVRVKWGWSISDTLPFTNTSWVKYEILHPAGNYGWSIARIVKILHPATYTI